MRGEGGREGKEGPVSPVTRPSLPMGCVHRGSRDETKTIQWPDTPLVGIQAGAPLTPQVVGPLIPIHESYHEDYFGRVNSFYERRHTDAHLELNGSRIQVNQ